MENITVLDTSTLTPEQLEALEKALYEKFAKSKREALSAYIIYCREAAELLEHLTAYVTDHGEVSANDVTQANVEDMAHLVQRLREAKSFIRNEEE